MNVLFSSDFILFIILVLCAFLWIVFKVIQEMLVYFYNSKIKGLSLYKAETVMSVGGLRVDTGWYKNDDDALEKIKGDFINVIYPVKRKLK